MHPLSRYHPEHPGGVVIARGDDGFEIRRGGEIQHAAHVPELLLLARTRPRVPKTHAAVNTGAVDFKFEFQGYRPRGRGMRQHKAIEVAVALIEST